MRARRGYTVVELVMGMALASLVFLAAVAMVVAALRVSAEYSQRRLARQNLRDAMSVVDAELREAVADPEPGGSGYLGLSPPVLPTGFIVPNANQPSSDSVTFTAPNRTVFDPSASGWDASRADNYRRVRYYVSARQLRREQLTYTAGGAVASTRDDPVVTASSGGRVALTVQWLSASSLQLTITVGEGAFEYRAQSQVSGVAE
jgi:type II secretory pathway component PulJ